MNEEEELEWAYRQYVVATLDLLDVFSRYETVPARIGAAVIELAEAMEEEWT